jgi:hypothetical protein
VELALKLVFVGWANYWAVSANRFDLVFTLGAIGGSVLAALPIVHLDPGTLRFLLILRLFRVASLLVRIKQFKVCRPTPESVTSDE